MNILVLSRRQVECLDHYERIVNIPHILISIEPEACQIPEHPLLHKWMSLYFHDVDDEGIAERNGLEMMDLEDADLILMFIEDHKDKVEGIVVQCEAGISRSAGIAAALDLILNGDDKKWWKSAWHIPNRHCYSAMINRYNQLTDEDRKSISGHKDQVGTAVILKKFMD